MMAAILFCYIFVTTVLTLYVVCDKMNRKYESF